MKKILAVALVLAMAFSLVACGAKDDAPATTAPAETQAAAETTAAATEGTEGTEATEATESTEITNADDIPDEMTSADGK